jgi:hypothetical protein
MQDVWERYMKPVDGHPASLSINASIIESDAHEVLPYVGFIKVALQHPTQKGFLSDEEEPFLRFIEDSIEAAVLRYKVGACVGRIVSQGVAHFIYYLKYDFEWKDIAAFAFKQIDEYDYEAGSRIDSAWEVYEKLLWPNLREWQIIHNHHACDALQEQGDALTLARAVEHSIYFNDLATSSECMHYLEGKGFKAIANAYDPKTERIWLRFYRQDIPFYTRIDPLTLELIDISEQFLGEYDGWECSVIKAS